MTRLYSVYLPETQQPTSSGAQRQDIATNAFLDGSQADVRSVGSQAADISLTGFWAFGDALARKLARELEELSESSITAPPLFRPNDPSADAGYVELRSVETEPAHGNIRDVWRYNISADRAGTHETHFRAVRTSPAAVDTPLGSNTTAVIGIPAAARKRRWYDPDAGTQAAVTSSDIVTTASAEFGDVDVLDVSGAPISGSRPVVVYELDFSTQARVDPVVWDTRGLPKFSADDEPTNWQHVFATSHEFEGDVVVENGLLRLTVDEQDPSLTAEEYNGGWQSVSLGSSSWEIQDIDLTHISSTRIDAQLTFVDGTDLSAADISLQRGLDGLLVITPAGQDTIPGGIQTLLDPIASDRSTDAQPTGDIIPRSEVRA